MNGFGCECRETGRGQVKIVGNLNTAEDMLSAVDLPNTA
jgi:hypothetical protein